MKVQIAFDLLANGVGPFLSLDDPVKGLLNGASFTLAGEVLVDVTDTVRQVSIKRGRNRQLDKFTAGNANVVMDNRSRLYDPTNTSSPYFGSIAPRKQVTISDLGVTLYTGQVDDWNFDYSPSGDSTAAVSCVDSLALLVDPILTAGTGTAELTGARINSVLTDVGWPLTKRTISVGRATLSGGQLLMLMLLKVKRSRRWHISIRFLSPNRGHSLLALLAIWCFVIVMTCRTHRAH